MITHTAATPQDSPSTTLDEFPEFRYSVCSSPPPDLALSVTLSDENPIRASSDNALLYNNSVSNYNFKLNLSRYK